MGRDGANTHSGTKLIQTEGDEFGGGIGLATWELLSCLLPDDIRGDVRQVHIIDSGSKLLLVEGVPVGGTINSESVPLSLQRQERGIAAPAVTRTTHFLTPLRHLSSFLLYLFNFVHVKYICATQWNPETHMGKILIITSRAFFRSL